MVGAGEKRTVSQAIIKLSNQILEDLEIEDSSEVVPEDSSRKKASVCPDYLAAATKQPS